jgi:hypothetical protein
MSKFSIFIGLVACSVMTLQAQNDVPPLLSDAGHCLATVKQDWLDLAKSKATIVVLAYLTDTKSSPGETFVYVVEYTRPDRSEGTVFGIEVKTQGSSRALVIQNNAGFVKSKKGVQFTSPPLGGTWTQEQLMAAIQQMDHLSKYDLRVSDLKQHSVGLQCKSYSD